MINKKIIGLIGISSVMLATTAFATGEGFYMGGQVGETNTHNTQRSLQVGNSFIDPISGNQIVIPTGYDLFNASNNGAGGRIFLGYNINTYWGLESGYTHYAASSYNVGSPNPPLISGNPVGKPEIHENGFDFVGKGIFPIGNFGVFGKAGIALVRTSLAGSLTTTYNTMQMAFVSSTGTTNYVRPTAAVGVSYDLTPNWVTEFTLSRVFGGAGFQSADLYSLGISYHFVDKYCGQFLC